MNELTRFRLISMLESAKNREELLNISRNGQQIMNQIEHSQKPVVAAVAGSCLGGVFEECSVEVLFVFV